MEGQSLGGPQPHWSLRGEVGSDGTAWGGGWGLRRFDHRQSGPSRPVPAQLCCPRMSPPTRPALCCGQAVFVAAFPPARLWFRPRPVSSLTRARPKGQWGPMPFWVEILLFHFFLTFSKYLTH